MFIHTMYVFLLSIGFFFFGFSSHVVAEEVETESVEIVKDSDDFVFTSLNKKESSGYVSLILHSAGLDFLRQKNELLRINRFSLSALLRLETTLLFGLPIAKSHFSFHFGTGIRRMILDFSKDKEKGIHEYQTIHQNSQTTIHFPNALSQLSDVSKIKKSSFDVLYGDIVMRIRFSQNKVQPKTAFFLCVGPTLSFPFSATRKISYERYTEAGKEHRTEPFFLKKATVRVDVGVGFHRLGLLFFYNCTSLFQKGMSPSDEIHPYGFRLAVDLL